MNGRRGVGLVELAVALLVASVAWGALLTWHGAVVRGLARAVLREDARWTLQSVADSVEMGGGPPSGRSDRPWGWVEWSPAGSGVGFRAIAHGPDTLAVLWGGPGVVP